MQSKHCHPYVLVWFISVLQITSVVAQTPSYYHYTTSAGLASSTVFDVIQDREGYIWFATLNGISRFDGTQFTTLRTKDGLNSNAIIALVEGTTGELYIGSYEKGINVLRNGRIENYCSEINGRSFATAYLLLVAPGNGSQKLYAYRKEGSISVIGQTTTGSRFSHTVSRHPAHINKLEQSPDGNLIALTPVGLFNFKNDAFTKLHINGLPDTEFFCLCDGDDGSYLLGSKGMIYRIKNDEVIRQYKIPARPDNDDVVTLLQDRSGNIWFSIKNRGFFMIPDGSNSIIDIGRKLGLQNTLVNTYLEDKEGNIWVGTYGKGVYCLNNLYLRSYDENDGMSSNSVYSIVKGGLGRLLIGTMAGVDILEGGRFDHIKDNSAKPLSAYIFGMKNVDGDFSICGAFEAKDRGSRSYKGMNLHLFVQSSFCKTGNGLFLFGNWLNSITVQREFSPDSKGSSLLYVFGDSTNVNRVNEIVEDTKNNVWIGTALGVCKVSNLADPSGTTGWRKTFFPNDPVLNSKIVSIIQDRGNNIWFAGDKGIARYSLANDSVTSYTNIAGHDVSSSMALVTDSRNRLWVGNMKGLYVYDGKSIKLINMQTGLPSDEVYSLCYDAEKNYLYVGTGNGISFLDIKSFDDYVPRPLDVKITSIRAGDSVYTNYTNLLFEPEQHNVSIHFKALRFSSPGSVKYRYNLNGEWAGTDRDVLDFVSLESGTYDLQIIATSQNSDWGKPSHLTFMVLPRFNETSWFKLGIVSILVLVSISVVAWRLKLKNRKIQNELELTGRINELKHQALSAMMNPHFIFNSLNSVQYLINCQRNEEANDYIAMMATLIRKNLDSAGSGYILLSEEIDRLKLYLDLEKLRFQERLSYEIITGADLDAGSVMIPNMIIQPFVENTLWHGLPDPGGTGLVRVSFTFENVDIDSAISRSLIIRISDNGIGLKAASKNRKEGHASKGVEIIEERLRLLSAKMQLPQPIVFEDLSSRSNDSHGTEVIISLPPDLYRILTPEAINGSLFSPPA